MTYSDSSSSPRLSVTWFVTLISLIDGFAQRIQHRMLVPHCCTHICVAHDIHHHREISGRSIRRRTKGVTCAIQHQGLGQSGFGARISELFCNSGEVPAFSPA
jgi:hypothetical protein